ncbi:hypothetical protein BJY04DRAFT_231362 [Aspergillus karnatakaensis]|uniref:uncharacterized protein n=1 Tax=Aspergillus karnatakaensis TaxID=1810916 RepID=UPI003CCDC50E
MAKTYLEVHPTAPLLVIDESASVGGTWAKERLYPGLRTNNVWGSYHLSDYPMFMAGCVQGRQIHIPGERVHAYFAELAGHLGIVSRLKLSTRVTGAEMDEDGVWNVSLVTVKRADKSVEVVRAKKLVVATGLTSKPYIPDIQGSERFGGLILHSKQLKAQAEELAQCKRVAVVGGNKSAWDVCYTAAREGAQVDMIIRPSGGGPSYVWPKTFSIGPFSFSLACLSLTRLFVLFDPAPLSNAGPFGWMKTFLHRTWLGQWIFRFFWSCLDWLIRRHNGYNSHPELKKLEPWTTPFWMGNSLSIHNYPTSWFDLVRKGKIRVHIADIKSLSPGRVHQENGDILDVDALVLCTGWTTDIPIQLDDHEEIPQDWDEALRTIYGEIPYLSTLPRRTPNAPSAISTDKHLSKHEKPTFSLLYHDMIPPQQRYLLHRNLAFIGMSVSIHAVLVAQAQALWITAFFSNRIPHLRPEKLNLSSLQKRAYFDRVYGEIRRPRQTGGLAGVHKDLVFDSLPLVDELLRDLGLATRRKGSWWRELTEAYGVRDYAGLVNRLRSLRGSSKFAGHQERTG